MSGYPWVAGDQLNAADLDAIAIANLQSLTAGPALTAGKAVVIGPYQSDGGVLLDGTPVAITAGNSVSVTVAANANRALVVFLRGRTNSQTVTSITYNSVAMTLVDGPIVSDGGGECYSYILLNPSSGSHTLSINMTSGSVDAIIYSYYNVKQSAQPDAHTSATSASNTSASLNTVAAGALVVGVLGSSGAQAPTGNVLYADTATVNASVLVAGDSGQVFASGTTISLSNTNSSNICAALLVSLAPATAPVTAVQPASSATPTTNQFFNFYTSFIGFTTASVSAAATGVFAVGGIISGLSGLVAGTSYYLNNTAGTIGISPGTNSRKVGIALSATTLLITNIW
jgi:hypothetical protein